MNNDANKQLDIELAHAGEETSLSPQMLLLEKLRITPERQLPKMDFLFRLFGKPCFPRRELVAITGKAKSGKTFVTSMLMANSLQTHPSRYTLPLKREREEPLRVLWYDTEQSDESTQDILKNRIMKMHDSGNGGGEGSLDVFNVRCVEWKDRRALLIEAVRRCKPDLVIVDGIRDLVNDINDGVLAQEVMEELLHLATEEECCIVCVLHQNKSGEDRNLRGWIGTELMNKAFEVYACEKIMPQRVFKLEQTLTRKYDIEQTMYFEVGQDGLPVTCAMPTNGNMSVSPAFSKERLPQLNSEYILHEEGGTGEWHFDVMRLFLDAMRGEEEVGGGELKERVCQLGNICSWKCYNSLLGEALEQKVIEKVEHDRRTFYRPAPF